MTKVIADLEDIAGGRWDGYAELTSTVLRPKNIGRGSIAPVKTTFPIVEGVLTMDGLDPGPAFLRIYMGNWSGEWDVGIPDSAEPIGFETLLDSYQEYEPGVVSEVRSLADDAAESASEAAASADRAEASAVGVDEVMRNAADAVRGQVAADADRAVDSATSADGSASESAASAAAALASESAAAASEESAGSSATAAGSSEGNAERSATAAGSSAEAAGVSETNAGKSAAAAALSESAAAASETAAAGSAAEASAAAVAAEESEAASGRSATSAAEDAGTAVSASTLAESAASAAENAASSASENADLTASDRAATGADRVAADESAAAAAASESAAALSETNAKASETAAGTARTGAEDARDAAIEAAQNAEQGAPADGWKKSELEKSVRDSLTRADTALQSMPSATEQTRGGIRLRGDLGGDAESPTVPGLSGKADLVDGKVPEGQLPAVKPSSGWSRSDLDSSVQASLGKADSALQSVSWGDVGGVPAVFPPESHTHPVGEVNGLQAALDEKGTSNLEIGTSSTTAMRGDAHKVVDTLPASGDFVGQIVFVREQ